jgi:murein DD-endopeptidase MepM/ murein hydrolase activator NlpD
MNPMGGNQGEFHSGIDIECSVGTKVKVTGGGKVVDSGWQGNYGIIVCVDHGFGLKSFYAHNSDVLVSIGDRVERGDVIALSGNTGRSTGPHVHYEVRVNDAAVDPQKYLME